VRVDERRELLKDETRTIEKRREVDQSRSRFEVEEKLRRRKWDEERERERERVVVRGKRERGQGNPRAPFSFNNYVARSNVFLHFESPGVSHRNPSAGLEYLTVKRDLSQRLPSTLFTLNTQI